MKLGNIVSGDHPPNMVLGKACEKILRDTEGKIQIHIFPENQLGDDADMLSQLRSGALLKLLAQPGVLMGTLSPVAAINGVGFAYPTYTKVRESLDGAPGKYVRCALDKAGIYCLEKSWNHGFRQVTSSTKPIKAPDDLNGFKIRVPPAPLWNSLSKAFGAAPVSIPWAENYSAMQTKIAAGLEQTLIGLLVDKMYEVQKYCPLTIHMWDGFWILSNKKVWERFPDKLCEIVERDLKEAALAQRAEVEPMNSSLQTGLNKSELDFFNVKNEDFRAKLITAGYYKKWQKRCGDEAWALLESTTGKL